MTPSIHQFKSSKVHQFKSYFTFVKKLLPISMYKLLSTPLPSSVGQDSSAIMTQQFYSVPLVVVDTVFSIVNNMTLPNVCCRTKRTDDSVTR